MSYSIEPDINFCLVKKLRVSFCLKEKGRNDIFNDIQIYTHSLSIVSFLLFCFVLHTYIFTTCWCLFKFFVWLHSMKKKNVWTLFLTFKYLCKQISNEIYGTLWHTLFFCVFAIPDCNNNFLIKYFTYTN